MKIGKVVLASSVAVCALGAAFYFLAENFAEPQVSRQPANAPSGYEHYSACEKQNVLWNEIEKSVHKILPENRNLGLSQMIAMSRQEISIKGQYQSDFAPAGWKKYLHSRGTIAKVKIVSHPGSPYTGLFQGADCGLLRLSLTYKVTRSRAVAPGLALKILRDGVPSANISALVSLDGQKKEYNFFKNRMSNIVPLGEGFGKTWVHRIFSKVSRFPEELLVEDLAAVDSRGHTVSHPVFPRQLFFVPAPEVSTPSIEHDIRESIAKIPVGTIIYKIYAAPDHYKNFDYVNDYKPENAEAVFKESTIHVADIVTTSDFVASDFGDDGIFFRHQLRY